MFENEKLVEFWEAIKAVADAMTQSAEQFAEAMRQLITPFAECLRQALEDIKAEAITKPRKPLPRPPKYAGPANKGRTWTRQPPRLARSSCRKMRR